MTGSGRRVPTAVRAMPRASALAPALAVALALAAGAGCGYAVGSGQAPMPAGAEKIFVAPLQNRTSDAEAGALLAAALRQELSRRGAVGGEGARARIEGAIVRSQSAPLTTQGGTWRLTFEVQARLVVDGQETARIDIHREVDYVGEVDALATEGRRRLAIRRAAEDAGREIAERLEAP